MEKKKVRLGALEGYNLDHIAAWRVGLALTDDGKAEWTKMHLSHEMPHHPDLVEFFGRGLARVEGVHIHWQDNEKDVILGEKARALHTCLCEQWQDILPEESAE